MTESSRAQLDWDEQGQPLSRQFGDVYFSRASGLEESRHVFLRHNRIAERCAALESDGRLVIGETGFGTGLNFLCAWQAFAEQAPAGARLHFVSVEKYPLGQDDLRRALALWPELAPFSTPLLEQYAGIQPGFQRLLFDGGRVVLTLLVGDALECLPQLEAQVDAWFLDGFAPAKNPQMWTPELFAQLARLSAPGASLATFTCAGTVRRGLIAAGFRMEKVKGFGHKREMLAGLYEGQPAPGGKPWFARPPRPAARRAMNTVTAAGRIPIGRAASTVPHHGSFSWNAKYAGASAEASSTGNARTPSPMPRQISRRVGGNFGSDDARRSRRLRSASSSRPTAAPT